MVKINHNPRSKLDDWFHKLWTNWTQKKMYFFTTLQGKKANKQITAAVFYIPTWSKASEVLLNVQVPFYFKANIHSSEHQLGMSMRYSKGKGYEQYIIPTG